MVFSHHASFSTFGPPKLNENVKHHKPPRLPIKKPSPSLSLSLPLSLSLSLSIYLSFSLSLYLSLSLSLPPSLSLSLFDRYLIIITSYFPNHSLFSQLKNHPHFIKTYCSYPMEMNQTNHRENDKSILL